MQRWLHDRFVHVTLAAIPEKVHNHCVDDRIKWSAARPSRQCYIRSKRHLGLHVQGVVQLSFIFVNLYFIIASLFVQFFLWQSIPFARAYREKGDPHWPELVQLFGPKERHLVDEDDDDVIVLSSEESGDESQEPAVVHEDLGPPIENNSPFHVQRASSAASRNVQSSLWDFVADVSDSEPSRETFASTARSKPKPRSKLYAKLMLTPSKAAAPTARSFEEPIPPYVPRMAASENNSSSASNDPYGKGKGKRGWGWRMCTSLPGCCSSVFVWCLCIS